MPSETKISKVRASMASGDWPLAFRIAGKFGELGLQGPAIQRAISAKLSPALYTQMGRDLANIEDEGRNALIRRFWDGGLTTQMIHLDETDAYRTDGWIIEHLPNHHGVRAGLAIKLEVPGG